MEKSLNDLYKEAAKRAFRKKIIVGVLLLLLGFSLFIVLTVQLYHYCLHMWIYEEKYRSFSSFWDYFWTKDGTISVYGLLSAIPITAGVFTLFRSDHKQIYDPQ